MNRFFILGFCLYSLLQMSGCARSPQTNFYTLTPTMASDNSGTAQRYPTVSIMPITLPELVDRPQLVVADEGTKVLILESHRWAEPLRNSIPRLIAEDLSNIIGADRVSSYPQYAANNCRYRIYVDFQRIETTREKLVFNILWSMRAVTDDKVSSMSLRIVEKIGGDSQEDLTSAYSRAIGGVAREIAKALPLDK